MKRGRLTALLIASAFAVAATGIGATAALFVAKRDLGRYTTVKRVIFFDTSSATWWDSGSKTGAYIWSDSSADFTNQGAFMDKVGDHLYMTTIPASGYSHILFVRCPDTKPAATFDDKYNQTQDIDEIPSDKNCVYLWGDQAGTTDYNKKASWGVYNTMNYSYSPS